MTGDAVGEHDGEMTSWFCRSTPTNCPSMKSGSVASLAGGFCLEIIK